VLCLDMLVGVAAAVGVALAAFVTDDDGVGAMPAGCSRSLTGVFVSILEGRDKDDCAVDICRSVLCDEGVGAGCDAAAADNGVIIAPLFVRTPAAV